MRSDMVCMMNTNWPTKAQFLVFFGGGICRRVGKLAYQMVLEIALRIKNHSRPVFPLSREAPW